MKLYIVSTDSYGYDEYDSFVVSAKNKNEALKMSSKLPGDPGKWEVKLIGEYNKEKSEIVHSSFNAG
jgi:hypothetical protein